jgi:hypothetical protein
MPQRVTGLLAGLVVASLSTAVGNQQLAPELTGFILTVQRTSDGITATCEAGCRWQSMTPAIVRCADRKPCLTITDARAGARASAAYSAFAVTVDVSSTGMALACERGCAWKTREVDCEPVTPCSVRISEFGASRAKPGAKVR